MRTPLHSTVSALLFALAALCGGCSTLANRADEARVLIQKTLDAMLPASFEGDTYFSTRVTYGAFPVAVTIRTGGLKRGPAGWEWKWLLYSGSSPLSNTSFVFGSPPTTLIP